MSYPQYEPPQAAPFSPEAEVGYPGEPVKKPRGCFFYGCITLIVLGLLTLIAVGIITYSAYNYVQGMVNTYTSTTPVVLPTVNYTDEQRKEVDDRWAAFNKALEAGEAAELSLTGDDINALLAENPEVKGKVYVTVKDGEVSGEVSYPLDAVPLFGKGRYLNGKVVCTVSLDRGLLDVRLKSGECNGKTLSPEAAKQLAGQNLAQNAMNDANSREAMAKIDSITVKGDKVILKSRAMPKADADETKKAETKKDAEPVKDDGPEKKPETPKDEPKARDDAAPKSAEPPKDQPAAPKDGVPKAA